MTRCVLTTKREGHDLTGVERLLYGSLSAVQCLLWLLYGAVWVDKHRVIIIEHRPKLSSPDGYRLGITPSQYCIKPTQ